MNFPKTVFILLASTAIAVKGDHADHAPLCSTLNVIDATTCAAQCDSDSTSSYEPVREHGDTTAGEHVDFLTGFNCKCEKADNSETLCFTEYTLPTCASEGLGECGADATKTCTDLCMGLGLEEDGDGAECEHVDLHEGHDHERILAEDEDHDDEEEAYTLCFCGEKKTMVCADEGWEDDHDDHDDSGTIATSTLGAGFVASLMISSAVVAFF